jgi:hypothetical protein
MKAIFSVNQIKLDAWLELEIGHSNNLVKMLVLSCCAVADVLLSSHTPPTCCASASRSLLAPSV